MTRRVSVVIALTLLLAGCGDSPTPETPATSPTPAITEYNKGLGFAERKDWDTAIACYSEAIRLKPDYAEAYYKRGNAYDWKGEPDQAIKDYSEAIRLKPDHADAYNNRGAAYGKKGETDAAIKGYSEAIRLKPDDPASHPVTPADIVATIYRCLGINPDTPVYEPNGRPVPVRHGGQPIEELLA